MIADAIASANKHLPVRYAAFVACIALSVLGLFSVIAFGVGWLWMLLFGALSALGISDLRQDRHAVLRNYPVIGHLRFLWNTFVLRFGNIFWRPIMRPRHFLALSVHSCTPAQKAIATSGPSAHSLTSAQMAMSGSITRSPPRASLPMISASTLERLKRLHPALLDERVQYFGHEFRCLERQRDPCVEPRRQGRRLCTRHRRGLHQRASPSAGGDLIWEIGSGYFGCRNDDGTFNAEKFQANARDPQVKMIELKLSQGAKPGHGGLLPGSKVTAEIAQARGVLPGVDCVSPAAHSAFSTPLEMMAFIAQLRELSGASR